MLVDIRPRVVVACRLAADTIAPEAVITDPASFALSAFGIATVTPSGLIIEPFG